MTAVLAKPTHPGLPTEPRRIGLPARAVRHIDATIEAGDELFAFAERLAGGFGGGAGLLRFAGLPLQPVAIHVPEPDPTRRQIMRYGEAFVFDEPCRLVGGQMSIGIDGATPVLHGHGHIRRADGSAFGGHLARGGCVVAPGTPATPVRCTVFDGVRLEPTFDAETGFALLSPVAARAPAGDAGGMPVEDARGSSRTGDGPSGAGGWMLRFKPDEDLVDAMAAFARSQGLAALRVLGGVGSLMRATLAGDDGQVIAIDGPGVEIVTLEGEPGALRLVVADLQGRVHAGRPVAGGNPICVTIELYVEGAE